MITLILMLAMAASSAGWDREFADPSVSWLLLDRRSGRVESARFDQQAIAPGSLIKPFLALAYGAAHGGRFPVHKCVACWRPSGHGEIGVVDAIAQSCNSYARMMAEDVSVDQLNAVMGSFGLPPLPADRKAWTGEGKAWRVSPAALAGAYSELAKRRNDPTAALILEGMRRSAERGTAKALGGRAFAKTGTGPCLLAAPHDGDGFVIAMMPREDPQSVLLVRVHNVPGAEAAKVAARMLDRLRESR
jgi:cell division protein FtsI/penicillin-binding protein 2